MLNARIPTALALVTLIASSVLLLPTVWLAIILGAFTLVGMTEWANIAGVNKTNFSLLVLVLMIFVIIALVLVWICFIFNALVLPVLTVTVLWWIGIAWRIMLMHDVTPRKGMDWIGVATGMLVLITTWGSLVWLHSQPNGHILLLFFLMLVWIADSVAYFVGHRWGKTQLAPLLSPRKTTEGVYGAIIASTLWGVVLAVFQGTNLLNFIEIILVCLLTVGASIIGDLHESLLKRERCLKDSGALLPGHGGVLDRIDSVTAAAPVFALGLAILGVIK